MYHIQSFNQNQSVGHRAYQCLTVRLCLNVVDIDC